MELLILEQTIDTPAVLLDPTNKVFRFAGKSLPEDVDEFYKPIENWINEYIKVSSQNLTVIFKLDYFNTASLKKILDILFLIKQLKEKGVNVEIKWNYKKDDDCMRESGEELQDIVEMNFDLVKN